MARGWSMVSRSRCCADHRVLAKARALASFDGPLREAQAGCERRAFPSGHCALCASKRRGNSKVQRAASTLQTLIFASFYRERAITPQLLLAGAGGCWAGGTMARMAPMRIGSSGVGAVAFAGAAHPMPATGPHTPASALNARSHCMQQDSSRGSRQRARPGMLPAAACMPAACRVCAAGQQAMESCCGIDRARLFQGAHVIASSGL